MKRSVLLVGNFLSSSLGTHGVCEDLAARLKASEWPVFTTSSIPGRIGRLLDMVTTVWRKRDVYAVALIDVYSGPAFLWAEAVCETLRWVDKPSFLTLRGGNLPAFAGRWPSRVHRLLRSAVAVTTPSRYLLENMKCYRADLHLLPNPLDLNMYKFRLRERPRPYLTWLRAFHSIYNPSLAPKVLSCLTKDFPDINLTMIGPDYLDGSLQAVLQLAKELDIADRMKLPGRIPKGNVPDWIGQGDIFLNTTNVDNAPVSVLEAMACGLCVVSTNVGGIHYLLKNGHDSLLVPPNDPEAMATAIRRLLTEPGLAKRLSLNARQKAEQFDWSFGGTNSESCPFFKR